MNHQEGVEDDFELVGLDNNATNDKRVRVSQSAQKPTYPFLSNMRGEVPHSNEFLMAQNQRFDMMGQQT